VAFVRVRVWCKGETGCWLYAKLFHAASATCDLVLAVLGPTKTFSLNLRCLRSFGKFLRAALDDELLIYQARMFGLISIGTTVVWASCYRGFPLGSLKKSFTNYGLYTLWSY
jgi:hypothetical protein